MFLLFYIYTPRIFLCFIWKFNIKKFYNYKFWFQLHNFSLPFHLRCICCCLCPSPFFFTWLGPEAPCVCMWLLGLSSLWFVRSSAGAVTASDALRRNRGACYPSCLKWMGSISKINRKYCQLKIKQSIPEFMWIWCPINWLGIVWTFLRK